MRKGPPWTIYDLGRHLMTHRDDLRRQGLFFEFAISQVGALRDGGGVDLPASITVGENKFSFKLP